MANISCQSRRVPSLHRGSTVDYFVDYITEAIDVNNIRNSLYINPTKVEKSRGGAKVNLRRFSVLFPIFTRLPSEKLFASVGTFATYATKAAAVIEKGGETPFRSYVYYLCIRI